MAGYRKPRKKKSSSGGFPLWTVLFLAGVVVGLALLKDYLKDRPAHAPAPVARQEAPPQPKPRPRKRPAPPSAKPAEPAQKPLPPVIQQAVPVQPSHEPTTVPPSKQSGGPRVVVVLDDAGYKLDLVQDAIQVLPASITFAVIPFLPESESCAQLLHRAGFPVILHQPMEPEDSGRWKPGPGELYCGMPADKVAPALSRSLAAVPYAEGVNNHMGSQATKDAALMEAVCAFLKFRGLYFLDSRTTPDTVAYAAAGRAGLRCAQRAVFLDDVDAPGAIMAQVDALAARALQDGEAVGIGHVRPNTIRVLSERIPHWESRGIRFVPLREVVR